MRRLHAFSSKYVDSGTLFFFGCNQFSAACAESGSFNLFFYIRAVPPLRLQSKLRSGPGFPWFRADRTSLLHFVPQLPAAATPIPTAKETRAILSVRKFFYSGVRIEAAA